MSVNQKLTKDKHGKDVDPSLYRSMIGSLLYLIANRPDISFSVGICARYQATPTKSHLKAVKRIIRYVHSNVEYGILYSKESNSHLAGYSDVDLARNIDDRKSTSGGCFHLSNNLVTWYSKKQSSISHSIAGAEYITVGSCCT
ncbi:secreted RxLR effector protein 161-like [Dioscorea cayenensis subsp. rotundata]|uniref:Secreted RxLR effector protein 161-like n=1 Tax=Dioscorea cayennensis subsp. rotundata TaxID=55577 RepID=A0AB40CYQ5_DIOCR|nr:secreted RxLR effector protein 161-like [Dioscorea cayenensis subsp. rotundata]